MTTKVLCYLLLAFSLLAGGVPSIYAAPERVAVEDFFKDPEFTSVSLSPTGEYITVSVPQGDRTVLAAFQVSDMKLIGKWDYGAKRHIDRVVWVNDRRFLMYVTQKIGRFDFRIGNADVYASDVDGKGRIDIPNGGFYQIIDTLDDDPDHILVSRSVDSAFLFKLNVNNARTRTVATAPLRFGYFLMDHEGKLRFAIGQHEDNRSEVLRRDGDSWVPLHSAEMGEATQRPLGFASNNQDVYWSVSEAGEPARVVLRNPESDAVTELSKNANVESDDYLFSADGTELLAVRYLDGLPYYDFVSDDHPESKAYSGLINAFPDHALRFAGVSRDGNRILFVAYSDTDSGSFYLFDRSTGQARFLLAGRDWIKPEQMSTMRPIQLTARDGTELHGYLTIPKGSDGKKLPLIFHPHGGPHGPRDVWGFNPEVQFFANRGYAVLQLNFRGSGGYGSAFERSGYRNWGTTMVDDMTDSVKWAIGQGIADPDRICTYGASYGGYAALQTVVREPDLYQCTIGYVGVYSLPLMFKDGDIPQTDSGRNFLKRVMPETLAEQQAQSPAYNVERIRIPVALVQGAKDVRVPISQYRLLKKRLDEVGNSIQLDIVEDKEAHGFYDFQNQVDLYNALEGFLDKHIGADATPSSALQE